VTNDVNNNVMDHTTPSALGCGALGIQSVVSPSDFAFLSHCSPVSLEAQLGLLDCERCHGKAKGGVLHFVRMEVVEFLLLKRCSLIGWFGDSTSDLPWHAAAVVSVCDHM
jgi:hypothetical protein